jgi:hypothetical protein
MELEQLIEKDGLHVVLAELKRIAWERMVRCDTAAESMLYARIAVSLEDILGA